MNKRFESNIRDIKEIITRFEDPNLTEARGEELYKKGKKLLAECYSILESQEGLLEEVYLEGDKISTRRLVLE